MSTALKLKILLLNILGAQLFFLQLGIRQHMAQKDSKSKQIHIQTTNPKPVIKSCKLKCRISKISSVNV